MSSLSYCIHSTKCFLSQENIEWPLYNGLEDIFNNNNDNDNHNDNDNDNNNNNKNNNNNFIYILRKIYVIYDQMRIT